METLLENLNWILMGFFVLLYSMLVILKDVQGKLAQFLRNAIYMGSGMLFVYYIFQISYLEDYEEFEYVVAFLIALTFRDLLPVIMDFVVKISTSRLEQIKDRVSKKPEPATEGAQCYQCYYQC